MVRGPQPGWAQRSSTMRASTSAAIWCGQVAGREESSASPAMPLRA